MWKTFKTETGITLITLAITIVIIIILSAVAINVIWGDNGLIKKAFETKDSVDSSVTEVDDKMDEVLEDLANSLVDDTEEAPTGTISFDGLTWVGDGTATIVITTDNLIDQLQYQINTTDGEWTTISNGDTVSGLHHNDTIYARLIRGSFVGEIKNTIIKDVTPPVVTISTSGLTHNSVTLNVNASDGQSGLATANRYEYYLGSTRKSLSNTSSYTYTGLSPSTKYSLRVVVMDNAGLTTEKEISISTSADPNLVTSKLREGDYVYYVDGTGVTRKCVVLYGPENANYSSYGIQIVTMDNVEDVTIGGYSVSSAMEQYNNLRTILNDATSKYLNTTYASKVRCVGTVPNNPNYDGAGIFQGSYSYLEGYEFKDSDEDYLTDYNKMTTFAIGAIGEAYWLPSRSVSSSRTSTTLYVRVVGSGGNVSACYPVQLYRTSSNKGYSYINGLRPVFTLKTNVKVTGGAGTSASPYTLGV